MLAMVKLALSSTIEMANFSKPKCRLKVENDKKISDYYIMVNANDRYCV